MNVLHVNTTIDSTEKHRHTTFLWNVKTHGLPKPYIEVNSVALVKLVSYLSEDLFDYIRDISITTMQPN